MTEPSGLKNGVVKGSYKFRTPGVYKVTLFIEDQTGLTSWVNTAGDVESIVVIYDRMRVTPLAVGGKAYSG